MESVLSTLILCAIVLTIGASVWSVTHSATSIMATDYYEEVMESVENVKERFIIENIEYKNSSSSMKIWIYNYGNINLNVTLIRVTSIEVNTVIQPRTIIQSGQIMVFQMSNLISLKGKEVTITVTSERGNKAYVTVHIPTTAVVQ